VIFDYNTGNKGFLAIPKGIDLKKVFKLQVENKAPQRQLESVKNEIRKYMKRERNKKLPEDAVYWDFSCRFGKDEASANAVNTSELTKMLDAASEEAWPSCYIEILAKAVTKAPKEVATEEEASE